MNGSCASEARMCLFALHLNTSVQTEQHDHLAVLHVAALFHVVKLLYMPFLFHFQQHILAS